MAGRAGLDVRRVFGTLSVAFLARNALFDAYFLRYPFSDLLKSQFHPDSDISSSIYPLLTLAASATSESAESTAESTAERTPEQIFQEVIKIAESSAEVRTRRSFYARMSELVISGLLVRIAQY